MNTGNLSSFLSTGFITILAAGAIILILKHWKGAENWFSNCHCLNFTGLCDESRKKYFCSC